MMATRLLLLNLLFDLLDLLLEILDYLFQILHQLLQHRLKLLPERGCSAVRGCSRGCSRCAKSVIVVVVSRRVGWKRCDRQKSDDRRSDKKIAGTKSRLPNMSPHNMLRRNTRPASQNESLIYLKLSLPEHAERIVKRPKCNESKGLPPSKGPAGELLPNTRTKAGEDSELSRQFLKID